MDIKCYLDKLGDVPSFLEKYFTLDCLKRLKKVGYFCGMDYASKDIYDFPFYISRFDHSLTVALLTWKYSCDKKYTIAALFHDVATPCFSHVIDYMNKDYVLQESTELKTEEILKSEKDLACLLKQDGLDVEDIINFKKYSIVDNKRPKLCADRLDGIILTSLGWTKMLKMEEISDVLESIEVYKNEDKELELGFHDRSVAKKVVILNNEINRHCHSNYDTYMMVLLADITKYVIDKGIINYDDLYILDEDSLIDSINKYAKSDDYLRNLLNKFYHIKLNDIPNIKIPEIKKRIINPLVNGVRYE